LAAIILPHEYASHAARSIYFVILHADDLTSALKVRSTHNHIHSATLWQTTTRPAGSAGAHTHRYRHTHTHKPGQTLHHWLPISTRP